LSKADEIIAALKLKPHPEGGHYRETFRDLANAEGRTHCTAIHFLLQRGERSHWHRIDAAEIWHWHRGAPLELLIAEDGKAPRRHILGHRVEKGEHPHVAVPARAWQAARPLGAYTLVSCTVAPGFAFSGFELAPPDFAISVPAAKPSKARARSPAKRRARHSPGRH
jgi:hypothetical protein